MTINSLLAFCLVVDCSLVFLKPSAPGYLDGIESNDGAPVTVPDLAFEGRRWKMGGVGDPELVSVLAMKRERSTSSIFYEIPEEANHSRVGSPASSRMNGQQIEEGQKKGVPPELVVAEDKEAREMHCILAVLFSLFFVRVVFLSCFVVIR